MNIRKLLSENVQNVTQNTISQKTINITASFLNAAMNTTSNSNDAKVGNIGIGQFIGFMLSAGLIVLGSVACVCSSRRINRLRREEVVPLNVAYRGERSDSTSKWKALRKVGGLSILAGGLGLLATTGSLLRGNSNNGPNQPAPVRPR